MLFRIFKVTFFTICWLIILGGVIVQLIYPEDYLKDKVAFVLHCIFLVLIPPVVYYELKRLKGEYGDVSDGDEFVTEGYVHLIRYDRLMNRLQLRVEWVEHGDLGGHIAQQPVGEYVPVSIFSLEFNLNNLKHLMPEHQDFYNTMMVSKGQWEFRLKGGK